MKIKTVIPSKCELWIKTDLEEKDIFLLTQVKRYLDEDHLIRSLRKCQECRQFYYYEFLEEIDWENGNDPQYRTYIPIIPNAETIEQLNNSDYIEILRYYPRLQWDLGKDDSRRIYWVR